MKGKILKLVVGITIAGVTGGGIWLFLRWRKKNRDEDEVLSSEYVFDRKEADQMLQEEIDKDPRSHVDIYAEISRTFDDDRGSGIMRDEDDKGHSNHDIDKEKFARGVRGYSQSEDEKRNFEEYMAAMMSPEEDDDEDEYDDEDEEPEEKHTVHGRHYPITAAQFCNTRNYYDKVSLSYFTDDNVVCDEKDKIMSDADDNIGRLQDLFEGDDYPSICYIRNEELEIDYEISIIEGSYRKEVLGEGV